MPAADSRSRSSSPYAIEDLAVTLHRSLVGAVWRWRTELSALLLVAASFFCGWWQLGSWLLSLLVLVALVLAAVLVPVPRRSVLVRWFWVLFTRHRLQRSFWELRLHTRAGRLPLVVWMAGTPVGVRAWVILRAGMTFTDFEDAAPAFAVACGARGCRVTKSARWSWLIFIEVMRRDALGPRLVRSPLADLPGLALPDLRDIDPDPAPAWPDAALAED
jgi:hypothetical protein